MKKCPFCAEDIQDDAIKCKHCNEWLKSSGNTDSQFSEFDYHSVNTHIKKTRKRKAIGAIPILREISNSKLIFIIILIPAIITFFDLNLFFNFYNLSKEIPTPVLSIGISFIYFTYGIWIADYIYKFKRILTITISSLTVFIASKFLIVTLYKPDMMGIVINHTFIEGIVVFFSMIFFIYLFRYFESKYDVAEIINEFESEDPDTKLKTVKGTCSKCGEITIIAKERVLINIFGKSKEYFCENCKRSIRSNPLNNFILGITEAFASVLFMIGWTINVEGEVDTISAVIFGVFIVGIIDGIKRLTAGISGIKRSIG